MHIVFERAEPIKQSKPIEEDLHNENGQVVVSSRVVAERFGKQHKDVLESIRNLEAQMSTAEFSALFIPNIYKASNGKMNPEYLMTRDGFTLLAMGFTGQEASGDAEGTHRIACNRF